MPKIHVDVGHVYVDVDLNEFRDGDLIGELGYRNYVVFHENDPNLNRAEPFTNEEVDMLQKLIDDQHPAVGSVLYNIREKLVRV